MKKIQGKKWLGIAAALLLSVVIVGALALARSDSASETASGPTGEGVASGESAAADREDAPAAERTATYTIEYNVAWSAETHPDTLPAGAHVSPIVVIAHMRENDLFASGSPATDGIEMMAETGATATLASEIGETPSILGSTVGMRLDVPGSYELELEFDQEHSLLSAVSMLAPSPDWFVAVSNIELFKDGQWLERLELVMRPYDAGTDSGTTFTAADSDTDPAGDIGPPLDSPFVNAADENSFATITVSRRD